ncbi:MAG TPA: hypothetical protein VG943_05290 [Caulobacterales bacterium]|nr:hypothetical protein [Caulobacterales bacterium]
MTRRADLGVWIAIVSGAAIVVAVIAGVLSVGGPGEARALRIDAARLVSMQQIAGAAQCAYSYAGRVPASLDQARADIANRSTMIAACVNADAPEPDAAISYAPDGADHIQLCADFLRPSPPEPAQANPYFAAQMTFPELRAPRQAAGRHCYSVKLVRQS